MLWLLLLWLLGATALGIPLAVRALPRESRLSALTAYAIVTGHAIQVVLLMFAWRALPLGTAVYVAPAVAVALSIPLWWRLTVSSRKLHLSWGLSSIDAGAAAVLLGLFAFLGHRAFTFAYMAGDTESRYWHSGLVSWLSRSPFPPMNPLEPNDVLHYRLGLHVIAAALSAATDSFPPEALAAVVALSVPMSILALVGASIRIFDSARQGLAASVLGLLGGSLSPYYYLARMSFAREDHLTVIEMVNPFLWHGNTLDMLHINPSIAVGFVAFSISLWVCWEEVEAPRIAPVSMLPAIAALIYLALTNEVYFSILVGGVLTGAFVRSLLAARARERLPWMILGKAIALVFVAYGLATMMGGLDGGVSVFGGGPGSLQMAVNVDHFGSLVTPPRQPDSSWIPVLSLETQLDTNFAFVLVPLLAVLAWKTSRGYAGFGMMASLTALILWATVYPGYRPSDAYRLGQAGLTVGLAIAPFVLMAQSLPRRIVSRVAIRRSVMVVAALLLTPHIFLAAWLAVFNPPPDHLDPRGPDYLAAEYLRQSTSTSRVLVPTRSPAGGWMDLYDSYRFDLTAGTLLAASGHAIPMGHHPGPHNPQAYRPAYAQASLYFDRAALTALKVDWVYVAPADLNAEQTRYLRAAEERDEITLQKGFGVSGGPSERLLFRVR